MSGISNSSMSRAGALLCGVLLVAGARPGLADPDETIQPSQAAQFVGTKKIVEGRVTAAQRDGNAVRLRLGEAPHDVAVALLQSWLNDFGAAPERDYLGKTVRVAGVIRSFRGAPEIVVRDPAAIQVVGAASLPAEGAASGAGEAAAATDSGAAADDSWVRQRLDALDQRVRLLEERLQQLESASPRQH